MHRNRARTLVSSRTPKLEWCQVNTTQVGVLKNDHLTDDQIWNFLPVSESFVVFTFESFFFFVDHNDPLNRLPDFWLVDDDCRIFNGVGERLIVNHRLVSDDLPWSFEDDFVAGRRWGDAGIGRLRPDFVVLLGDWGGDECWRVGLLEIGVEFAIRIGMMILVEHSSHETATDCQDQREREQNLQFASPKGFFISETTLFLNNTQAGVLTGSSYHSPSFCLPL